MGDQLPSKKQHELLSFIEGFIKGNGYGPSYREIMRALDYKSVSTVAVHVDGLIARGYLVKRDHSARSLEVINSQISGNPVEKTDRSHHETWLKDIVITRLKRLDAAPTGQKIQEIETLIEALRVLNLSADADRAQAKLVGIVKRLDQTSS